MEYRLPALGLYKKLIRMIKPIRLVMVTTTCAILIFFATNLGRAGDRPITASQTDDAFIQYLPIQSSGRVSAKKGLGWGASNLFPDDFEPLDTAWVYNWDYELDHGDDSSPIDLPYNVEYVPMISCTANDFDANGEIDVIEEIGAGYGGRLLILNEPFLNIDGELFACSAELYEKYKNQFGWPDTPDASFDPIDITKAAAAEYIHIRTILPNARLIGPQMHYFSIGNPNDQPARNRLNAFRNHVYDLTGEYPDLDGYGIHVYADTVEENVAHVRDTYRKLIEHWEEEEGRKIEYWVTEFAYCSNDPDAVQKIYQTVTEFELRDYVTRYAYFTNRASPYRYFTAPTPCLYDLNENLFLFESLYPELCDPNAPLRDCVLKSYTDIAPILSADPDHLKLSPLGTAYKYSGTRSR